MAPHAHALYVLDTVYTNRIKRGAQPEGVRALSTVLKTLAVLDRLAMSPRGMRLPEVACTMQLSRPTAYQRLLTLVRAGWVEQDDQGRYRLSLHSSRIAAAALEQADLGARVRPALEALVEEVDETASLAVLDRGVPCIIQRVESKRVLRAEQKIGTTLSLADSASGRILTAWADQPTLQRLLTAPERLASDVVLSAARIRGHALSNPSSGSGVVGVAVPVLDDLGSCIAALSLVVPQQRFDLERVLSPLKEAARVMMSLGPELRP